MKTINTYSISLFIVGLSIFLSACSNEATPVKSTFSQPNVVLISIDTCRTDYLEPYGGTIAKTPNLSAIAEDGLLFEDAVTPVPLTLPAHTSLLTGLHPIQHGVRDNYNNTLNEAAVTLAELFRENGYTTAAAVATLLLSRRSGLAQGFDDYDDVFSSGEMITYNPIVERKGDEVVASGRKWLKQHQQKESPSPFFLFLHFYDPHTVYNPPPPYRSQYKDNKYAGEIAFVDDCIGQLVDEFKKQGLYEDLLLVVVGDHGEGLGDHKEKTHGLFLYEECVRVPMIFKLPESSKQAGRRIKQSAILQDVLPTLAQLCDLGTVPTDGISLAPWLFEEKEPSERWSVLETQYPLTYNWSPFFALRNQEWKYIHAPDAEFYHLSVDPNERNSLFHDLPEKVKPIRSQLEERLVELSQNIPFEPAQNLAVANSEVLASLGYVGGSGNDPQNSNKVLPDPKYKIEIHNLIDRGLMDLSMGNLEEAHKRFIKAATQDPNNAAAYYNLGLVHMRRQEWERATQFSEKALSLAPNSVLINLQLSRISINQKDFDKAQKILNGLIQVNPKLADAHFQLGWIELLKENHTTALEHFQTAKKWMPEMPDIDNAIKKAKEGMSSN